MKFALIFSLLFFNSPVWAVSFDWSGWTRAEAFYQHSDSNNYYGNYHFVLQPKIHVIDGLTVNSRLDLSLLKKSFLSSSDKYHRQTGFVFIYGENSKQRELGLPQLFPEISQIYLDYEAEFFKIRLGRAPYHFGMGANYSASQNPFQHWMTVYNQVAVFMEYSFFHIQPMLFHQYKNFISGAVQAGLKREKWKASAIYQYNFQDSSFMEIFGEYNQTKWGLKGSAAYNFKGASHINGALEAFVKIPTKIPFQLEVKTGGARGEMAFHPNYNAALLYGNRFVKPEAPASKEMTQEQPKSASTQTQENANMADDSETFFQVAQGQIQDGLYFSPRILFSFLDESLKIRPMALVARDLKEKRFYYEFDLEGAYQLDESLYLSLTGGVLYSKKLHFALVAQAAVSF